MSQQEHDVRESPENPEFPEDPSPQESHRFFPQNATFDDVNGDSLPRPSDAINPTKLAAMEQDFGTFPENMESVSCVNITGSPQPPSRAFIVLFTHLSSDATDAQIRFALSSIKWWTRLGNSVKIVIYVAQNLRSNALNYLRAATACDAKLGRVVLQITSELVLDSHIPFSYMFQHCYSHFDAFWYAYADYGVIFDASLVTALKMLKHCSNISSSKGTLVMGQSHAIEVHDNNTPQLPFVYKHYMF